MFVTLAVPVQAQHEQHVPPAPSEPMDHMPHEMMLADPIGLPASRHGSGTSWMPDSTPMYGALARSGDWDLMYHGAAFPAYDDQNGPRGDRKLVLLNWAMLQAQRPVGTRDQWRLSAMISLDPITVGGSGYPLLFQTGETWNGEPLIDHQHPHNFFTELSAKYTHAFAPDSAGYVYLAPVGEPAFGPVTFMHRTFALDGPLAPIGHHWQDATHIAYGVVTLGYQKPRWQLEASTFNGREPGENRYEIESPEFDSFSARLSVNPSTNWALQASHAFIESPESLHPEADAHRTTLSATYNRPLSTRRNLQSTFVWGRNNVNGLDLDSFLLEGQVKTDGGWSYFARYEWIEKDAEELVLPPSFPEDQVFDLQQITLGTVRDLPSRGDFQWGIGLQVNFNLTPDALAPVYGRDPTGWLLFLRIHPKRMAH
jgi:hypothetical protein